MTKQALLSGLTMVLIMVGSAEAAYRCEGINAEGQREIVFSDLAIAGYECIDLRNTPPPAEDPEAAMQRLRDQVDALDQDTMASNQPAEGADARTEQFAENCQIARDNLGVLQSEQDVVTTDAEGNRVLLNNEQRQQQLEQASKDVDYYCNP